MIFRPEMAKRIRAGQKTQTRRPVKPGEKHCRYQPGRSYALQTGRGKIAVDRITVTDVRQEPLGQIDHRDARREGFRTTQGFLDYWKQLYGTVDLEQPVWVITFVLGDHTDQPVFLARHGNYTLNPAGKVPGEGEVLDSMVVDRLHKETAREREDARALALLQAAGHVSTLQQDIRDMKQRQLVKRAIRCLELAAERGQAVIRSGESLDLGAAAEGPPSSTTPVLAPLEAA